jgi:hypothetical protein
MARIVPLAVVNVAYENYLSTVTKLTGRTPSKGIDSCQSTLSDFAKYSASLAEFHLKRELDPKQALRRPGPWLRHTFFSILLLESPMLLLRLSEATDLDVLSTKGNDGYVAIVSGNLEVWRNAVITCCQLDVLLSLRSLFNEVKSMFEQIGLADIWFGFSSQGLPDGTFFLEYKG